MGKLKDIWENMMNSAEPGPEDFPESEREPEVKESPAPEGIDYKMRARLFIKVVNETTSYVDNTFLSMFDRGIVQHAVNISRQTLSKGRNRTMYNYFTNKSRYMAIIGYLYQTNDQEAT